MGSTCDKLVTLLSHCNDAITSMIYSGIAGGRLHKREIYDCRIDMNRHVACDPSLPQRFLPSLDRHKTPKLK